MDKQEKIAYSKGFKDGFATGKAETAKFLLIKLKECTV